MSDPQGIIAALPVHFAAYLLPHGLIITTAVSLMRCTIVPATIVKKYNCDKVCRELAASNKYYRCAELKIS